MSRRSADGLTPSQRAAQRVGRSWRFDRAPAPPQPEQLPLPVAPQEPQS